MRRGALGVVAALGVLSGGQAFAQDEATIQEGKEVYQYWCSNCHDEGPGYPGTTALAAKYRGTETPGLLEARTDLSLASIKYFVRRGVSMMPFFRKTEISDADLDALAAYLAQAHLTRKKAALTKLQGDIAELETRATDDPADHVNRTALAVVYLQVGRVGDAVAQLEEAIRTAPTFAPAHYNLGTALVEQGKRAEAIEHYRRAVEIKPSYPEAHNNLGGVLLSLGNLEEAAIQFRLTLQFDSQNADAHFNLGSLLQAQGKLDAAIAQYQQALAIGPDDAATRSNLGRALAAQGSRREAVAQYDQSLELDPDFFPSLVDLAWLLATSPEAELRNANRAMQLAGRAADLTDRTNFIVMDTLAAAYAAGGKFDQAVQAARSAIELAEAADAQPTVADPIRNRLQTYLQFEAFRMTR